MRIVEWNCQGAFRLKNKEILDLNPDILIIPECEHEEKLEFDKLTQKPNDFLWYGDSGKKGIAIFSFSDYKFKILKEFNPKFRYIIPIELSNNTNSFLLFAVWAMDNKHNPLARYIGQIWNAINYYQTLLTYNSIIIGDFNSNKIWDEKERVGNNTEVVNFLTDFKIVSLYHEQEKEQQGEETQSTFFMHRNIGKPYHIDYIFASKELIKNGYKLEIGNSKKWIEKSDHMPIILDINNLASKIEIKNTFYNFTQRHLSGINSHTRTKFEIELNKIEILARELDSKLATDNDRIILINKVETIKTIDKLIKKYN